MAFRYHSRRKARKLARKSKRNFIVSIFLIAILMYATISWILPLLVNGIGSVKNTINPTKKTKQTIEDSLLAPPILNIPYEATNTAQININGYSSPNSHVALFLDDDKVETVKVSEDGTFNFKDIDLMLGTNNIYGKSIDEENRESLPSKSFKIIYDNEKPKLDLSEPEDNKKIQGGDKKIKFSGNTETGVRLFINNNQIIVDKDGNFSSEQSLNEGDNNFEIKAVDEASNTNQISRNVTYSP